MKLWRHIDFFFKMAATESEIYFRVRFWWWHSFGKMKIYWRTKFRWDTSIHGWDKTTSGFGKRTAAILEFYFRFLVLPNFRHRRVIVHWPTKFRQSWITLGGVMTSYRFLKMAAGSYIGFDLDNIRPPTKCNCWSKIGLQIWSWSDLWFIVSPNDVTHRPNPQKALPYAETHRLSPKAWKLVQRFDLGAFPSKT